MSIILIVLCVIFIILFFSFLYWFFKQENKNEYIEEEEILTKKLKPIQNFKNLLIKYQVKENSVNLETLKNLVKENTIWYDKNKDRFYVPNIYRNRKITKKIYGIGIYIIYFDISNFPNKDFKSIPCYIGQSSNITNRWMWHIRHLENCKKGIKTELKYNKILQFAKMNNLNLKYLRFSILEKTYIENLDSLEEFFINLFKADLNGWNWFFN